MLDILGPGDPVYQRLQRPQSWLQGADQRQTSPDTTMQFEQRSGKEQEMCLVVGRADPDQPGNISVGIVGLGPVALRSNAAGNDDNIPIVVRRPVGQQGVPGDNPVGSAGTILRLP